MLLYYIIERPSLRSGFQAVMGRQLKFVQAAIAVARKRRCHFMLHLDDDEILFPRSEHINT